MAAGATTAAVTTAGINAIDEEEDNLWDGVGKNALYGGIAGAAAGAVAPAAAAWGRVVGANAVALTGYSSATAVGTAASFGYTAGVAGFAGSAACAIGSGANYYDCYNAAGVWSGVAGGSYLAGEGVNIVRNLRPDINRTPGYDPAIGRRVSPQKQERHLWGNPNHKRGGYFYHYEEAQEVLDAYHSNRVQILGAQGSGDSTPTPVVCYRGVTGINHNPGSGYFHQPTNVFWIKGIDRPVIVPISPKWTPPK